MNYSYCKYQGGEIHFPPMHFLWPESGKGLIYSGKHPFCVNNIEPQ